MQVPPGDSLQPEAIGAVMEATKWLKPLISVSRIGDSASVQAATRVNAEQASKMSMCRPTRRPFFAICRDRFPCQQCVDRRVGPYRPPLRRAAGAEHDG